MVLTRSLKSLLLLILGIVANQEADWAQWQGATGRVAPLPSPDGTVVRVKDTRHLRDAIEKAGQDTTILIEDGEYSVVGPIRLRAKRNVTIRGASGDARKVVLRGKGWGSEDKQDDILRVEDCENITVAQITFSDCHSYGVKVEAEKHPKNIHILQCHFRNIGMRGIKGSGGDGSAVGGSIRGCYFENTKIPPADWLFKGDYISAIDMMALDGWVISDNCFKNIKGRTGGARAAIFVWVRSRNVTVERNLILHCDRGIAFGNPSPSTAKVTDEEFHLRRGVCRNNFIVPGPDAGIELWWVEDAKIYHNTIWREDLSGRGIRYGSRNRGLHIANNLVRGAIGVGDNQTGADVRLEGNLAGNLDGYFIDPTAGDLRLTSQATAAIDTGVLVGKVTDDFDGRPRDSRPDIGASERELSAIEIGSRRELFSDDIRHLDRSPFPGCSLEDRAEVK